MIAPYNEQNDVDELVRFLEDSATLANSHTESIGMLAEIANLHTGALVKANRRANIAVGLSLGLFVWEIVSMFWR